jgi:GTPase SAR1 family protein
MADAAAAEAKAKKEADAKAEKEKADAKAKQDAEEKAKKEADAKAEKEKADAKAKQEAEEQPIRERMSVRMGIVGCVSAGKSTLLNAINIEQLSDTKRKRTTMLPQAYLETIGKNTRERCDFESILNTNREANDAILNGQQELTPENCRAIYHKVPHLYDIVSLAEGMHLDIFDVPGLDDANTEDIYFAYLDSQLPFLNVVLLVVDIENSFNTAAPVKILERIARHAKNHPQKQLTVCVVANKCDSMQHVDLSAAGGAGNGSNEVECVEEELNESFEQALQTVDAKLGDLKNVDYNLLRMSAEFSYLYRTLQRSEGFQFDDPSDAKLLNKLGVHQFGQQWKCWDVAKKQEQIEVFLTGTSTEEALKLSGWAAFHAYLNEAIDLNRQSEIARSVMDYRLSIRLPALTTYTELPSVAAEYEEHGAVAMAIDATLMAHQLSKSVATHFAVNLAKLWSEEGQGVEADCESAAAELNLMKQAFADLASRLGAPFEPVAQQLRELVVVIKARLSKWYASLLRTDETYIGVAAAPAAEEAAAPAAEEAAAPAAEEAAAPAAEEAAAPAAEEAAAPAAEEAAAPAAEEEAAAPAAEEAAAPAAEEEAAAPAAEEAAAPAAEEEAAVPRNVSGAPGNRVHDVTPRLSELFAKLQENDYEEFEALVPEVHAKILHHMCSRDEHGASMTEDHPIVSYCRQMIVQLHQLPIDVWFTLCKDYLRAMAALPPPTQFDLPFLVFRTTLDRELNRVDSMAHSEAFGGYLLQLKCVNTYGLTHLGFSWYDDLQQQDMSKLSRTEMQRTVSLYALVEELAAATN